MIIKKSELQEALEMVKPGLATKELIEQSTSFAFIGDRVITYNDEISISHPIEGLEIEGAIKGVELYQLLTKLKKEELEISIEENQFIIKSGRSKAGLTLQNEITLPLDEIGKLSKWKKLPTDFIHYLNLSYPSCSRDMSKPVLTCVHINENGYIEASDSFKVMKCELGEPIPVPSFLLPVSSAIQVSKMKVTHICKGEGWVHFKTKNNTIISCRMIEEEYPDTSHLLDVEGIEITLPNSIMGALERAKVFAKRDYVLDESILFTIEDKRLLISAKSDSGTFKEKLNIRYNEDPISFEVIPYLLQEILKETLSFTICENRMKFEGTGWVFVCALKETIK